MPPVKIDVPADYTIKLITPKANNAVEAAKISYRKELPDLLCLSVKGKYGNCYSSDINEVFSKFGRMVYNALKNNKVK